MTTNNCTVAVSNADIDDGDLSGQLDITVTNRCLVVVHSFQKLLP